MNAHLTGETQIAGPAATNALFFPATPTVTPQERAVAWLLDYLGGDGSPDWQGIKEYQARHVIEKVTNILMLKSLN